MAVTGFGKNLLVLAMSIAKACYSPSDFAAMGATEIMTSTTNALEKPVFFVYELDDALWIAIRGSVSTEDFQTDVEFKEVSTSYGKFHSGFYSAAEYVFSKVQSTIKNFDGPIYITGHSYGGAVTTVLHVLAAGTYPKKDINCLAFAPVPAMEPSIASSFSSKMVSVVNDEDSVPTLSIQNLVKALGITKPVIAYTPDSVLEGAIKKVLGLVKGTGMGQQIIDAMIEQVPYLVDCIKEDAKNDSFMVNYVPGTVYQVGTGKTKLADLVIDATEVLDKLSLTLTSISDHAAAKYVENIAKIE